jgi:hypothetical protein
MDDPLPLVLIVGDYLYGTARSPFNYSFELFDVFRWRAIIEDIFQTLLHNYNLHPLRRQPAMWPDTWEEPQRILTPPRGRRFDAEEAPRLAQPERPVERIALAIARDFQRQGEVCPITQEPLKLGEICVTGCLCVFQGEALQGWARGHSTCPSCRKQLIYRTVTVTEPENIMIGN